MKKIKIYEPTIALGGAPMMEEYPEGSWVTLTVYEALQDENRELEAENKRLMALVNSHTDDS